MHCLNTLFSKVRRRVCHTLRQSHAASSVWFALFLLWSFWEAALEATVMSSAQQAHEASILGVLRHINLYLSACETLRVPRAAANQPEHHLLQLGQPRGAAGQEDHGAGLLVLLHPREDGPGAPEPRLP